MTMDHSKLQQVVDELVALGADRDELAYWTEVSPYLAAEEQAALYENLAKELEALKKAPK